MSKEKRIGCVLFALVVGAVSLAVCVPCPPPSAPPTHQTSDASADVLPPADVAVCADPDAETDARAPDATPPQVEPPYCFAHKKEAKAFCALAAKVCDP